MVRQTVLGEGAVVIHLLLALLLLKVHQAQELTRLKHTVVVVVVLMLAQERLLG